MFNLNGKIALITGTGKESIGYGIAKGLSKAGATIVFNTSSLESKNKALKQYEKDGINAYGYVFDVTNETEVSSVVKHIEENIGFIDILINNAGIIKRTSMHEMSVDDFTEVINVDLIGPFIVSKAVLPSMMNRKKGKIINICSMMSEFGRETVSAYAAAKGGLKMLTKNIASEYGYYNIQCNGIGPGYISTPLTTSLRDRQENGERHPFDKFIISNTPAQRWGEIDDLAGPAIFLSSEASNFVNGQILYVDGGLSSYIGKQEK